MQESQKEQLVFIQNFAMMISTTFSKFATLCRQQINSNKTQMTGSTQAKPVMNTPKVAPTMIQKPSQPVKNISNNSQIGMRKPHNALSLFISDQRQKILKENPNLDFMQVTQRASAKWKNMSEQQKKPYLQKYEILKNNYQKQKDNFDPDEEAQKEQSKKALKESKIAQKNELAQKLSESQRQQDSNEHQEQSQSAPNSHNQNNCSKEMEGHTNKVTLSTSFEHNSHSFEQSKIQDKDDYEEIKFSQDEKERHGEIIQIPQTQNEP